MAGSVDNNLNKGMSIGQRLILGVRNADVFGGERAFAPDDGKDAAFEFAKAGGVVAWLTATSHSVTDRNIGHRRSVKRKEIGWEETRKLERRADG